MIAEIGIIITLIGIITGFLSMSFGNHELSNKIFIIGMALMLIGTAIMIVEYITTISCRKECTNQDLIFSHQEYNQCSEELTCYCKQPVLPPKPRVVIIE